MINQLEKISKNLTSFCNFDNFSNGTILEMRYFFQFEKLANF